MMQRIATILVFSGLMLPAACFAGTAAPATADGPDHHGMHHQGHHDGFGHDHGGDWEKWFSDLKLTTEQKQSLKDIAERYRPRLFDLRDRGEAIRDQLIQSAPQDADYAARTQSASQAAGTLAADAVTLLSQMRADMDGVLTPVQRQSLKDRWNRRQEQFDRWKERHGGAAKPATKAPAR